MTGGIENKWVPKIELVDTEKKENGNIIFTLNTNFNKILKYLFLILFWDIL